MSLETWKAEFYPVPASTPMNTVEACEHSLRKWRGLTTESLAKHGCEKIPNSVFITDAAEERFEITGYTCSLCHAYHNLSWLAGCGECPINKVNGTSCDRGEDPYRSFTLKGNPQPMIEALEKALAWAMERQTKAKTV
jgi:hypothetical protein